MKKLSLLNSLILLGALTLGSQAGATGTAAGTAITNQANLDYTTDNTTAGTQTLPSNTVTATVQQVFAVSVLPNGTTAAPGQVVNVDGNTNGILTYTVSNPGNGADTYTIATAASSASVTAAGIKYYVDTDGNGSYTPGTDVQITAAVPLSADQTKTFFAVYPVPTAAPANTAYDITPGATSVGDSSKTDTDNLGRLLVRSTYDVTFAAGSSLFVKTPGSTTSYANTLTNTGNATITYTQIAGSGSVVFRDKSGVVISDPGGVTYTVTAGGFTTTASTPGAALQGVLTQLGSTTLAQNGTLAFSEIISVPANLVDGTQILPTFTVTLTPAASATVSNNDSAANGSNTLTDTAVVQKGIATISKTQALCGTNPAACPNLIGSTSAGISPKPGDYIAYYLNANNTGTGNLYTIKVKDAIPANTQIYSVGAFTSQTGTLKYSADGTTWTTDPTTLTLTAGVTLYVAVENGGSATTIDGSDTLGAGKQLLVRIKVKVLDQATATQSAPQADTQIVQ